MLHSQGPFADGESHHLLVAKNNHGPPGTVGLFFSPEIQRFEESPAVHGVPSEEEEIAEAWRDYLRGKESPEETP